MIHSTQVADSKESISDSRLLITVDLDDFEAMAARIALILTQPRWHTGFSMPIPLIFRDGQRVIRLLGPISGVIMPLQVPPAHLAHLIQRHVTVERVRRNGRRAPWGPAKAWIRRFLGSPYARLIPSISWHPEYLRPDGRVLGWSVVDWPEHLVFTDWT